MENRKRILVVVFSGLVYSGKSFFRNWVMSLPEYKDAVLVSMDDTREFLWPGRSDAHITRTEHVFKNEATRFVVKAKLIVERPQVLFLEMMMLTRDSHQRPFVEMIHDAKRYLQAIEREEAERDGVLVPDMPIAVDFRCFYFYCDLAAVRRRIQYRLQEVGNPTNASVFDLEGFLRSARQVEIPPFGYTPLYVNTADESPKALARQRAEVLAFLRGEMPISEEELRRRAEEAVEMVGDFRPQP
ncbi:MAG: hypothetical protein HYT49_00470 [Candidatus Wildermuthbacteria bacterium]|nr:hypothetical protein [Candidatus Wildermuthbacteria bacterium]